MRNGVERGAVYNEARYRQGYDHSEWNEFLPRRITPSDIDVVFDNAMHQRAMFCDYSAQAAIWSEKSRGQQLLYQSLLLGSEYRHVAVLCSHSVPPGKPIRSLTDVDTFHVMRRGKVGVEFFPDARRPYGRELWRSFVASFYGVEGNWDKWWTTTT